MDADRIDRGTPVQDRLWLPTQRVAYFNWYGYREKRFADRSGAWYVILPNGKIRKADAGGNLAAGSLKATVDPLVWDDPSVLFA
jgi:hypothetical protein